MNDPERDWNETFGKLQVLLKKIIAAATNALGEAWTLRHYNYEDNPMQSEADYLDFCDFMEEMEKHHTEAQTLLKKFYKQ